MPQTKEERRLANLKAQKKYRDSPKGKRPDYMREYHHKYRERNRVQLLAKKSEYRKANKEKCVAGVRKWRSRNGDKVLRKNRQWKKANPEKVAVHNERRRSLKASLPSTLTHEEWKQILKEHKRRCHYCGVRSGNLHQEHKVPISKGGGYTKENIVPACPKCNLAKGTKSYKEFKKDFG